MDAMDAMNKVVQGMDAKNGAMNGWWMADDGDDAVQGMWCNQGCVCSACNAECRQHSVAL